MSEGDNSLRKRLPSFRAQRDLSLGAGGSKSASGAGAAAKKFVPNLNVRRKSSKPDSEEAGSSSEKRNSNSGSNGSKKKEPRSTRNVEKPVLIQTTSVFSEGVFSSGKLAPRAGCGGSGSSGSHVAERVRSTVIKDADREVTEDEKARLKKLLRDDFIDDVKAEGTPPIQLPMINTGSMFKDEEKKVKRKNPLRILDDDDEEALVEKKYDPPIKNSFDSIKDFVHSSEQGQLFLIQLPDILPGEKNLGSCEEGKLGSIQVRASGQTRLVLENGDELDLEMGTQVGFLQNAISVRLDDASNGEEGGVELPTRAGDMTVIGQVLHRLIVTPSWEALLKKSGTENDFD